MNNNNNNRDLLNLIDSDSNSDSIELLDLPQPKGKKIKRRKLPKPTISGGSTCTALSIVKTVVLLIIVATVAVIGVVAYSITKKTEAIEHRTKILEELNKKTKADYDQLKTNTLNMTNTFHSVLYSCRNDLFEARKNYTKTSQEIKLLKDKLQPSQGTSDELETLKTELARLGSKLKEMETMNNDHKKEFTDLTQRVKTLEVSQRVRPKILHPEGGREQEHIPQYIYAYQEEVDKKLAAMNETISHGHSRHQNVTVDWTASELYAEVRALHANLTELSHRIDRLPTESPINITDFSSQVIARLSPSIVKLIKSKVVEETNFNAVLSDLTEKVSNMSILVKTLGVNVTKLKTHLSSSSENATALLRQSLLTAQSNIQALNSSLAHVRHDISTMNSTMTQKLLSLTQQDMQAKTNQTRPTTKVDEEIATAPSPKDTTSTENSQDLETNGE